MTILAKIGFASKNYFCQSRFYRGKTGFSTFRQKPANPVGLSLQITVSGSRNVCCVL